MINTALKKKAEEKDSPAELAMHFIDYVGLILIFCIPYAVGSYFFLEYHGYIYGHPIWMYTIVMIAAIYFCFIKTLARKCLKAYLGEEKYMRILKLLEDR